MNINITTILSSTVVATIISSVASLGISTTIFKRNFRYQKYYDKLSEDLYELQSILGELNFYIAELHNLVEGQEEDSYSLEAEQYKGFLKEREHLILFLKSKPFILNKDLKEGLLELYKGELKYIDLWWGNHGDRSGGYEIIKDKLGNNNQSSIGSFNYDLISEKELSRKIEKSMQDIEKIMNKKNRICRFLSRY
ncbi:hypothetical protein [Lactococcus petauri]|uniref:SMODS and SLOG-associating 2TM effector domain-containing protein n=1 Tax=Lactococcus petauri TaxID=1940789 RepID=A0ABZ2SL90_9LACT|nr:hypothetical protein [Lactococcus petauri]